MIALAVFCDALTPAFSDDGAGLAEDADDFVGRRGVKGFDRPFMFHGSNSTERLTRKTVSGSGVRQARMGWLRRVPEPCSRWMLAKWTWSCLALVVRIARPKG